MAKLRHIAMAVPDIEKAGRFYEEVFGMRVVEKKDYSMGLTDGVISLVLISNSKFPLVKGHLGPHHIGFVVEDIDEAQKQIEARGGAYDDDKSRVDALRKYQGESGTFVKDSVLLQDQRKMLDPDGVHIEIANTEHARQTWRVPV